MTLIKTFPATEPVVAMINFNGSLFVATTKRVYVLKENKLHALEIVNEQSKTQALLGQKN